MKKRKALLCLLLAAFFAAPFTVSCKQDLPPLLEEEADSSPLPDESAPEESVPVPPPSLPDPTPPSLPDPAPPVVAPVAQKAEYVRCTGNDVNLRAGAGTDFAVLGTAAKGTTYAITSKSGGWYKTYYRGKTAYISASYGAVFNLEKTEEEVERVIGEGYKLIGVPYVYGAVRFHDGKGKLLGGFTAQKFDCSSLVQYVFYKGAGTLLGLTTRAQVKQGTPVKRADLQRGDCIFFTNEDRQYNTGIERVGHVAIYLGDNYILHTASDYARIEQVSAKRWSFYIEARRFL